MYISIEKANLKQGKPVSMKDIGLAALSGLMVASTFPDYGLWPVSFVALAPFFISIRGKTILAGSWLGFVMGIFYFGPTIYWVSNTMTEYAHMPSIPAFGATALMVMAAALFTFMFAYVMIKVEQRFGWDMALSIAPFLWVSLELIRGHLPIISFPWARLADSFYTVLPFIQIADITGEDGIGFIIVLVNVAVVKIIDWKTTYDPFTSKPFPLRWALLCIAVVTMTLAYGQWRLHSFASTGEKNVKVALIQGNIDQGKKWKREYRNHQLNIYFTRTREAVSKGARIVVWPETAAPFYFGADPQNDRRIKKLVEEIGIPIIFGAPGYRKENKRIISYNRAWAVRPGGTAEKYDKTHLVPFGEYIPLKKAFFFLDKLVTAIGDMEPGQGLNLLDTNVLQVGPQICYEIIFPKYSRVLTEKGATAIVNISNDSWYGDSPASRQSMAMGVFRAIENRIPVLRAAQSGITALIDRTGKITEETKLFVETTLMGEITPRGKTPLTFFTKNGEIFAIFCLFVTGVTLAITMRSKR